MINPLADATTKCLISMTPRMWLGCAANEAACIPDLLHEFSHLLHSCYIYRLGRQAESEASNQAENDPERARLGFLARQASLVSRRIADRTACLAALAPGDLHDPRPNACAKKPLPKPGTLEARCEPYALPEFPGQWVEAEADFWSASGMAIWLEQRFPESAARRRFAYENWAGLCQAGAETRGANMRQEARDDEDARLYRRLKEALVDRAKPAVLECATRPAEPGPAPKPWKDPHQSDDVRANRNLLRNSDLRRALGCDPRPRGDIPLTCSPAN